MSATVRSRRSPWFGRLAARPWPLLMLSVCILFVATIVSTDSSVVTAVPPDGDSLRVLPPAATPEPDQQAAAPATSTKLPFRAMAPVAATATKLPLGRLVGRNTYPSAAPLPTATKLPFRVPAVQP